MSGFIDTNMVVRYLLGEPTEQAQNARRIVESDAILLLTPVGIVEAAYVMVRIYGVAREEVVDRLVELIRRDNVEVVGLAEDVAVEALLLCRPSGRVSVADAMIWAIARSSNATRTIFTFDRRFPSEGVELRDTLPA